MSFSTCIGSSGNNICLKKNIYFNGRFLTQSITGVQRTAYELMIALDILLEVDKTFKEQFSFVLIYSGELINPIHLRNITLQKKGFLKGNLWEQLLLPYYTYGSILISMCMVAPLIKRKQIIIVHDASFKVNPSFFSLTFRIWYRFAISILGSRSKQIITVSNFSRQELIEKVGIPPTKISVIYNAADHMLRFKDVDESFKVKINAIKPYCLAVSSLSLNKNFGMLTKALEKVDFSLFKMIIAGGISNSLSKIRLNDSVEHIGYVTDQQLKYLYSNATLFIFPSIYEGFGIPPLEAMYCGCPVLASNSSSLPEVLGDACQYLDPRDPDDIASKIHYLINNESMLYKLQIAGLVQAHKYSWKHSAIQLLKLIEKYV